MLGNPRAGLAAGTARKSCRHDPVRRGKFDAMAAGQQQIVNLLTTVIDQRGG
jgi:hypothetical protein